MTILRGRVHRFDPNDNINTDYIISGRYKFKIDDIRKLAEHVMEDIDPDFAGRVEQGDIIVAGRNFGCGSSREQAPRALKAAGVSVILAESFARIFYRSAFNIGLPLMTCETGWVRCGDTIEVDLSKGEVRRESTGTVVSTSRIPQVMQTLLSDGGLTSHIMKHNGFSLATGKTE